MVDKELKELLEKFSKYVHSDENNARLNNWLGEDIYWPIERWRGRSAKKTGAPYTLSMDISGYSPMLGIDCVKYYSDPDENLKQQLRYGIWDYENIPGGRYFEPTVFCSLASVYEASFFGAEVHFLPNQAPWFDEKKPIINDRADLLKIKPFDFETTGLIPLVIKMYEHHSKIAADYGLKTVFPWTSRSQFSAAIMIRGFENLLCDMLDEPEFFEELMAYITDVYKQYAKARKEYLNEDSCIPGSLGNDEISTPVVSPALYREMIYPYEKEIAEYWGGARYWHSCGQTEAFYSDVATLPGLQIMHIGPWSDIAKAVDVFGSKDISLEICRNSIRDLFEKDEDEMIQDLENIKSLCEGRVKYQVRMDGIAIYNNLDFTLDKVRTWIKVAEKVLSE